MTKVAHLNDKVLKSEADFCTASFLSLDLFRQNVKKFTAWKYPTCFYEKIDQTSKIDMAFGIRLDEMQIDTPS
ncbi:hypothetical protein [Phaeodactylibacter xiamenensis]|uniref:hypothetical protein n=1 Tax=Phaeodactylibacter xiamenensis TaxID=1524460 RepID=UPI003CCC1FF7